MKALVGAFNQEKALVRAFSVIVKTDCATDGSSAALLLMGGCCWPGIETQCYQPSLPAREQCTLARHGAYHSTLASIEMLVVVAGI